jgi:hypothetical protein
MDTVVDATTGFILMALLPLVVLVVLYATDRDRDEALWWIAAAFAVSWLADVVADMMAVDDRWAVTLVYPVLQTTLIGAALLLDRRNTVALLIGLSVVALIAVVSHGSNKPDLLVHSSASLPVVAIAWHRWELPVSLRIALVIYFGLGWLAWVVHVEHIHESWSMWAYQLTRLAGLLAYAWATIRAGPQLRLVRRAA